MKDVWDDRKEAIEHEYFNRHEEQAVVEEEI